PSCTLDKRRCGAGGGRPENPARRYSRLLRVRHARPRRCRAPEQRDKVPALNHSITSSARARSVGGTSIPSALAVLRFTISSYLVGACTGRSAGFSPLRMRSTYPAALRCGALVLGAQEI